jgi:hypothetical protein
MISYISTRFVRPQVKVSRIVNVMQRRRSSLDANKKEEVREEQPSEEEEEEKKVRQCVSIMYF